MLYSYFADAGYYKSIPMVCLKDIGCLDINSNKLPQILMNCVSLYLEYLLKY